MAQFPTLFQRPDRIHEPLYVVTTVFNSPRFRTRWELYEDFRRMVKISGAILYTVEVAFGHRDFAVTQADDPTDLQLSTTSEIWIKENAINLGVQRLPRTWQYVAWVDSDIRPVRDDWDDEIIHALQHYAVIQPWTQSLDLTSDYEISIEPPFHALQRSVGWAAREGKPIRPSPYYYGGRPEAHFYHPGYMWATKRDVWDGLGGLLDFAILGSADNYMAQSLLGQVESIIPKGASPAYRRGILEWQDRALAVAKKNIGATDGLILHHYHGSKASRGYSTRNQIIEDTAFDPETDLRRNAEGVWQLGHRTDARSLEIRDRTRQYFHARREDDPSP